MCFLELTMHLMDSYEVLNGAMILFDELCFLLYLQAQNSLVTVSSKK